MGLSLFWSGLSSWPYVVAEDASIAGAHQHPGLLVATYLRRTCALRVDPHAGRGVANLSYT